MTDEEHLNQHFDLCVKVYLRMKAEGKWLWADSQNSEHLVESEDHPSDL